MSLDEIDIEDDIFKELEEPVTEKKDDPKKKEKTKKKTPKDSKKKKTTKKKDKKKDKKEILTCGQCLETSDKDFTIKKRKIKFADGSEREDNLCDECFEHTQKVEEDSKIEKPEVTPELKVLMPDLEDTEVKEEVDSKISDLEKDEVDIFFDKKESGKGSDLDEIGEATSKASAPAEAPSSEASNGGLDDLEVDTEINLEDVTEPEIIEEPEVQKTKETVILKSPPILVDRSKLKPKRYKPPTKEELEALASSDKPAWDDDEMDETEDNTVYAHVGDKGTGKTTIAFSYNKDELPDTDIRKIDPKTGVRVPTVIACLSLDKQGLKIANKFRTALWETYSEKEALVKARIKANGGSYHSSYNFYKSEKQLALVNKYMEKVTQSKMGFIHTPFGVLQVKEIHVFNGMKYYVREPPDVKLISSERSFEYWKHILDDLIAPLNPDYIVVDGCRYLSKITENTMRIRNNKSHIAGIKNPNIWKERDDYIDYVFDRSIDYSLVSPIFTMFFKLQQIKDKEGNLLYEKDPEWVKRIQEESNNVIEFYCEMVKGVNTWFGHCQSPKDPGWRTSKVEVTTDMLGNGGVNNLLLKNQLWKPTAKIEIKEDIDL